MAHIPHILFIILDCARADHLSCYGYHRETSPHIDRIAEEGVLYRHAISPSPWTLPSHASLFTGSYVSRHGADIDNRYLDRSFVTMAEVLRQRGYRTLALSSNVWVSAHTGLDRGFDEFYRVNNPPYENKRETNFYQKVVDHLYWNYYYQRRYDYGARRINKLMRRTVKRLNGSAPFFIFINYLETHLKYEPPGKFRHAFLKKEEERYVSQDKFAYFAGELDLTEEDFSILGALYDGEIRYVDYRVGELIAMLSEQGVLDDTLIVITSDHGENIGDHGLMDHQYSLHDSLIRVPLIIRYPRAFPRSTVVEHQVQSLDLMSTLCDLLGIQHHRLEAQLQGMSLLSSRYEEREAVYAEYLRPNLIQLRRRYPHLDCAKYDVAYKAIRTSDYKYIEGDDGSSALYGIHEDPGETSNLYGIQNGKSRELKLALERWTETLSTGRADDGHEEPSYTEQTMRVLKDLGYM